MTIYSNSSRPRRYTHVARNIYKQHHGSIPKDIDGRSYEIHHVDGNRYNNEPANLIAVTIQEHYQIHSSLQDWGACYAIAVRMKMSHDELSALATKNGLDRVDAGTHPWSGERGSIHSKKVQKERITAGTHHFAGEKGSIHSKKVQKDLVDAGIHHLLGGSIQRQCQAKLVAAGTHHFLTGNIARRMVEDGTHPFAGERGSIHSKKVQKERITAGTHPFLKPVDETHPTQKLWCCEHCAKEGRGGSNYRRWHGDKCKFKPK